MDEINAFFSMSEAFKRKTISLNTAPISEAAGVERTNVVERKAHKEYSLEFLRDEEAKLFKVSMWIERTNQPVRSIF